MLKLQAEFVEDVNGIFVGRAIGFPRVIAQGNSVEEVKERLSDVWEDLYEYNLEQASTKDTSDILEFEVDLER